MNKDKALDLALEALEYWAVRDEFNKQTSEAITAIKQARSAPVQEPYKGLSEHMMQATNGRVGIDPVTGNAGIGNPPAAPVQEPAIEQGWDVDTLLDKPAAQRQWVWLTDEDIEQEFGFIDELLRDCVHRTEAKVREKNNG